ncbi:hypothetical protein MAHJHV47_45330 [Mycobacterium avium subsp. hominissuis]
MPNVPTLSITAIISTAVAGVASTAVLMMAVMDKVGTFGMLRYCLQLFPDSCRQ